MTRRTNQRVGSYTDKNNPHTHYSVWVQTEIRPTSKGPELSVCADVKVGLGYVCGGQCVDELLKVTRFAPGWNSNKAKKLVAIWRRWHLNSLQAGCEHQRELGWDKYDEHPSQPCPVCGYKFGTAWLYEPLPGNVIAFINSL